LHRKIKLNKTKQDYEFFCNNYTIVEVCGCGRGTSDTRVSECSGMV